MNDTPRTDEFVSRMMWKMALDPEDFASPWALARMEARLEAMMTACEDFMRMLEREASRK